MLDLLPTNLQEGIVNDRVAMDLSQYLLSASPPSLRFDFMAMSIQQSPNINSNDNNNNNNNGSQHQRNQTNLNDRDNYHFSSNNFNMNSVTCPFHHSSSSSSSSSSSPFTQHIDNNDFQLKTRKRGALKSSTNVVPSETYCSDSDGESCGSTDSRSQSPRRTTKRVSFADHKGLALAQVRFVKESPDEPPQLSSKVLSLLTRGANAGISSHPPVKLCFSQPASDYMAFRDKVIHNLISLENVILQDYTVKGTIKVKNITFEKEVFVRVSVDEWLSFEDHEATYVPGPGCGFVDANDTFSFQLDISPSFDITKKIQFAVCFKENGKEHWDNNGDANYCIVSERYESELAKHTHAAAAPSVNHRWLPEKGQDSSWAEFSVWRDLVSSDPYY